jgi:hypothetical protein
VERRYFAFDGFSVSFTGGCSVHMWASNSLAAALISGPIIGAHQEHIVQVAALPPSVIFVLIERLTCGVSLIGTTSSFSFAQEVRELWQFISSSM